MRTLSPALTLALSAAACLCIAQTACAQQSVQQSAQSGPAPGSPTLAVDPDAPAPATAVLVPAATPSAGSLTLRERFVYEARTRFGPTAFLMPAFGAGLVMVDPPHRFPHDWTDGPAAFGRNYGAILATDSVSALTHFAVAAADREDPRYYPSLSANPAARVLHTLTFTLIDRYASGRPTLAFSNLAGSAAGGFVGMAWEPGGFDDTTHAYQRASIQLAKFAANNLLLEFKPETHRVLRALHLAHRGDDTPTPSPIAAPR